MSFTKKYIEDQRNEGNDILHDNNENELLDIEYEEWKNSELVHDISNLSLSEIIKKYGDNITPEQYKKIVDYKQNK